jgi:hypothetical protein
MSDFEEVVVDVVVGYEMNAVVIVVVLMTKIK